MSGVHPTTRAYDFAQQADGSVLVTGGTAPYVINGDTCSCPSFKFRRACKHLWHWHEQVSVFGTAPRGVEAVQKLLPTRTADELVADESLATDVEWIVPGLVARGALTAFYGIGKGGKSTLATYVGASIVAGLPCLGEPVTACDLLWLDLEQHVRLTRRKLEEARAFGHAHRVHAYNGPSPDDWTAVEATLTHTGAGVLVIDSLSRFLQLEDENAAAEVTAQLGRLVDLVHRTNVALLAIHHDRKSGGGHGRGMRGSSAFLAAFDIAVHVKREGEDTQDPRRRLESVSRYDEGNRTVVVRREADGRYTIEGSAQDVRRGKVLAAFTPGEELDLAAVNDRLEGVGRTALVSDLKALHDAGQLQRRGAGKRGDVFRYSLPETVPEKNSIGGTPVQNPDDALEARYSL